MPTGTRLAKPPREYRTGDLVARQVGAGADEQPSVRDGSFGSREPLRDGRQRSDQREQQPPAAAAQRIEPQGREERQQRGLDEPPLRSDDSTIPRRPGSPGGFAP